MATLENIRKRGKLLAFIIGFALFAFILGDLIQNGQQFFSGNANEIAEIDGKSVEITEYRNRVLNIEEIYKLQTGSNSLDASMVSGIREQVWTQLVQEYLLKDSYSDLAIDVTTPEFGDLIKGANMQPSPLLAQMFANRESGQYDAAQALNFFKNMDKDPNSQLFGAYLEDEVKKDRKFSKYTTLIQKGLNATEIEIQAAFKERSNTVDFEYLVKKYSVVNDSTVSISDEELKKYYNENKKDFEQKYTRDIAYISFDIVPSEQDKKAAETDVAKLLQEFKDVAVADVPKFMESFYLSADPKNYKSGEFTVPELDTFLFKSEPGVVYGPYLDQNTYKITKLVKTTFVADTVGARHILFVSGQNGADTQEKVKKLADSVLTVIKEKKTDFAELAKKFSADTQNKDKGGDLDKFTEGKMVQQFNDTCFASKTGDIKMVETSYGVHIVEITYQSKPVKKVKIATIEKEIIASEITQDVYRKQANEFAVANQTATDFQKSIEKQKLTKKTATGLEPATDVIPGLDVAGEVLGWTFNEETEEGQVSKVYTCGDRYVIAVVTSINEEGIAPFEKAKDKIKPILIKEKKGTMFAKELKDAMAAGKSFEQMATEIQGSIKEGKGIAFSSSSIPGEGIESALIAAVTKLEANKVSEPVIGENGVFVVRVKTITPAVEPKPEDLITDKNNILRTFDSRARRDAYEALKLAAEIKDKRYKFSN